MPWVNLILSCLQKTFLFHIFSLTYIFHIFPLIFVLSVLTFFDHFRALDTVHYSVLLEAILFFFFWLSFSPWKFLFHSFASLYSCIWYLSVKVLCCLVPWCSVLWAATHSVCILLVKSCPSLLLLSNINMLMCPKLGSPVQTSI